MFPTLKNLVPLAAPKDHTSYTFDIITADMVALLDHLRIPRAVFLGHDWGGEVVWKMCLYHPKRVEAVGAVCTPFSPRLDEYIPLETLVEILPAFRYQMFLISKEAPKELNSNVCFSSSSLTTAVPLTFSWSLALATIGG